MWLCRLRHPRGGRVWPCRLCSAGLCPRPRRWAPAPRGHVIHPEAPATLPVPPSSRFTSSAGGTWVEHAQQLAPNARPGEDDRPPARVGFQPAFPPPTTQDATFQVFYMFGVSKARFSFFLCFNLFLRFPCSGGKT